MSFVAECIQDSLPIGEQCLNSPFLQKLENGTLEESSFLGYIIDDSLYLREYAKVFAWGMTEYLMACLPCIISQTKVANR